MSHLELLRNEHVRLQTKFAELQRRYDVLEANRALHDGGVDSESGGFVNRLVETVMQLYQKDLYSDITIHVDGHQLRGHRFVIYARTNYWGDMSAVERIEFTDMSFGVAQTLLKWMYTDVIDEKLGDSYILSLLSASVRYEMDSLKERCESLLISNLEVDNCVKVYQFAEKYSLERLRTCCMEFVSARWKDFQPEHFVDMAAPLLYQMLKGRSQHVLNSIITLLREDVLFLYLIENNSQLIKKLNEPDDQDQLPLDLALETGQTSIAQALVTNGADTNKLDARGLSFLWKAIERGDVHSCEFLLNNSASVNFVNDKTGETLLHLVAHADSDPGVIQWISKHIERFQINATNEAGETPLMTSIEQNNKDAFDLLVAQATCDVNLLNGEAKTALEIALLDMRNLTMAEKLVSVDRRANLDLVDPVKGETLFHKAIRRNDFSAIQFLVKHGANMNKPNSNGSTALHVFMSSLPSHGEISGPQLDTLKILLKAGADPTLKESLTESTPLHFAVERDKNVLKILLELYSQELPLSVLDKEGRSPLWCALLAGKFDSAKILLDAGADVNEKSADGEPLLVRAIMSKRDDITRFLLDNKAIAAVSSSNGFTCLNLAVEQGLTPTVDYLCKLGANLNHPNPNTGLPPLWTSLERGDYGTAEVLVGHGCDMEGWAMSDDSQLEETLLHRAIDNCNQKAAVFLIKSGCDVNALRRLPDPSVAALLAASSSSLSLSQNSNSAASLTKSEINPGIRQTPLHASVQWGLTDVSRALISNLNCKIDAQDYDGRTAAHIAVVEQDQVTLELLLSHPDPSAVLSVRDRYGQTPLALAIKNKNNKAAEAICKRLPHTAVQVNGNGENLLHCAVKNNDLESVLFLLGLQVDVNIPTQDQKHLTSLHICADVGNELILRNLLLAGGDVNALAADKRTPMHVAAKRDNADICRVLLENGGEPNVVDADGNNALHVAVANGATETAKLLLLESDVDYFAVNKRRQNIMHLCAINIGIVSAEMFMTVLEAYPDFPLEAIDMYGNTMFLLSFLNGNSELCRLALKNGACMGVVNQQGQSVFNIDTPTKQLLFGLLDGLEREPQWADGELCSECNTKFTLTMRKHHCRHCGRLVCSKCSERQMPILKYNLAKNVRVCQICYDVLTMGSASSTMLNNNDAKLL